MEFSLRDRAAICGIGQTAFAKDSGRTELDLACEAIIAACDDAGLPVEEIDGIVRYDIEQTFETQLLYTLGLRDLRFMASTPSGGGGVASTVVLAALAVATGAASHVVCFRSRVRSKRASYGPSPNQGGRPWAKAGPLVAGLAQFHHPFGLAAPAQEIALIARRHMHEHGTKAEHFGMQAVTQRYHASRNPNAIMREPITLEDWRDARKIAEPIRLPDCSLENDGAVALIVTSAERARDLKKSPAYVMAAVQAAHPIHTQLCDYFRYASEFGDRVFGGRRVFDLAGITPTDVDAAMIFDHFSPAVIIALEQYGFCGSGEAGPFVESGATRWPDGSLPVNTHGGSNGEAFVHGFNHLPEAVRQVRGTAVNQVEGCEIAFACGSITDPSGAILLRR